MAPVRRPAQTFRKIRRKHGSFQRGLTPSVLPHLEHRKLFNVLSWFEIVHHPSIHQIIAYQQLTGPVYTSGKHVDKTRHRNRYGPNHVTDEHRSKPISKLQVTLPQKMGRQTIACHCLLLLLCGPPIFLLHVLRSCLPSPFSHVQSTENPLFHTAKKATIYCISL